MNPFTDEYLIQEVEFYCNGLTLPYEKEGVVVKLVTPTGRLDDYLNVNYRASSEQVPLLQIDGSTWMSLTYMELQSAYLAIKRAKGKVGTGGLGLGYFALRAANKEEVESIDVYETEERVIRYFQDTLSHRPEYRKINIIKQDVRTVENKSYDFFFMDVYQTLLPDKVLEDMSHFTNKNNITPYHFWGEEKVILEGIIEEYDVTYINKDEKDYFKLWIDAGLNELYRSALGRDFIDRYLEQRQFPMYKDLVSAAEEILV